MDNLRFMITADGLQLRNGHKVIEVKNSEVNKGKATLKLTNQSDDDYILAIGDDYTDEGIFKVLPEDAHTIRVGKHMSAARYYVDGVEEVRNLLSYIAGDL